MRKSEFLSRFLYEDLSQGEQILWLNLQGRFGYYSEVLQDESWLEIGFECDGESVPQWLFSIVPPFGSTRKSGVAHDGLYTFGGYFNSVGVFKSVTRHMADKVYYELARLGGVNRWRASVRYWTLRCVGWKAWGDHVKERDSAMRSKQELLSGMVINTNAASDKIVKTEKL